ncbi:MAG: hypothetical protein NC548_51225 [Lachnospiraceae bacterium]|nr:hypothetical protein [Lachnospiraceae bacterium]
MTVKELKDELSKYPDDMQVYCTDNADFFDELGYVEAGKKEDYCGITLPNYFLIITSKFDSHHNIHEWT